MIGLTDHIDELLDIPTSRVSQWTDDEWKANVWDVVKDIAQHSKSHNKRIDTLEKDVKKIKGENGTPPENDNGRHGVRKIVNSDTVSALTLIMIIFLSAKGYVLP